LNYQQILRFPFLPPKPWGNIAMLALCHAIPLVGPIVAMGYGAGVEKALLRDPSAAAPRFDFNNFMKYLERGVAPFVIALVLTLVMVPAIWGAMVVGLLLVVMSRGNPVGVGLGVAGMFGLGIGVAILMTLFMLPFTLRAMLLGNIGASFDFRWSWDFVKRMAGPALIATLVMQLIAFPIILAGLLACYVGMFFSISIVTLMHYHLQIQLYQLYLDRGGTPLPIRDDPIAPAFPVLQPAAPPIIQR